MKNIQEHIIQKDFSQYFPYPIPQIKYLANCSEKYKYIYVSTPKVACSTIIKTLQYLEVGEDMNKLPQHVHDRHNSPLLNPYDLNATPYEMLETDMYFRFTFVRNPYTRILSAYLDKIVNNQWERNRLLPKLGYSKNANLTLTQFLETIREIPDVHKDIHWTPQYYLIQPDKINYHVIGRFENFSIAFKKVIEKINSECNIELFKTKADHHKTNAGSKILDYIGKRERDLILEIFEDDFVKFGYSEDPFFAEI
ncbi:sulfotransferase family protein [Thermopetrobacter sp. TC1]|uniref:sulfotransferase family protein n=1 Tax=Thermopetrobacter sp. TC1 TaxID=1495045 RepID=UPI0018CFEDDB|nr:sulfotransferase family protein [Thermopetrobacter sp. TC1]